MTLSGLGAGQGVNGFIADPTNPFDPVLDGYPTSNPSTGFTPLNEGFAGVIFGSPTGGGPTLSLYCFDIHTDTWIGVGYTLGTWDAANVPNVGYVARILNEYYPYNSAEPSNLTDLNQRAAAVQAAIWFFSDRYVLDTSSPLYGTVVGIVDHIIAEGPVTAPQPPSLSITPSSASGPTTSAVVGPFTVTSSSPVTVTATGNMWANAAATIPIAQGSTVSSGQQVWLTSVNGSMSAVLQATATATVPQQNVYLYDGNTSGTADAQRLMLALNSTLTSTVSATAEFRNAGNLVVSKTITGPAARQQGQVTIHTVCGSTPLTPDFVVASGSPAGTYSRTYTGIPAGSTCAVTETANGETSTVEVTTTGDGGTTVIPSNGTATLNITDDITFVTGSLIVKKSIGGPAAGQQAEITIRTSCVRNGATTVLPDFVIPAGATGEPSMRYDDIPGGSVCTVAEPGDGSNTAVAPPVTVFPGPVTVPAAGVVEADVTDDFIFNTGSLTVTKTITGTPGSTITITTTCVDPKGDTTTLSPVINIPPGPDSFTYTGIPGHSVCNAVETADGSSTSVAVVRGGGSQTEVPPGGSASINLTNTYEGGLAVNKTIQGPAAGLQGALTISTYCVLNGVTTDLTPDLVIPARAPAGTTGIDYTHVASGSVCTTTETSAGNPANVAVSTTIVPSATVTIPTGDAATVDITNDYTFVPASLVVTKNIDGPAAGSQGAVTIEVTCSDPNGNPVSPGSFTVPASSVAGGYDHTFDDIPAGSICTVTETEDGSSSTVAVTTTGSPQTVAVPVSGATATVTDDYTVVDGSLVVSKMLGGPLLGQQGAITISGTCGTMALPDFVIPAGTTASPQQQFYDNIPAGATCTLTETADGSTDIVTTTVLPTNEQTVTVPAATVVPVVFADIFTDSPGTLTVTKDITGTAAGRQGEIGILVDCGQPTDQFAFIIPAGTPAGSISRSFDDIPAGSTCTITETATGQTNTAIVSVTGSGQQVAVPANGAATASLIDTVTATAAIAAITSVVVPITG